MQAQSEIKFHLDDVEHTVPASDVSPETTLNSYLRDGKVHLTATKKMCLEGGCGTCIVAADIRSSQGKVRTLAVNSCLVSILSCHGWKIHTNEGIGNPLIGYHSIQKLLASNNGTQCGFCSSGMVMNMYALVASGKLTQEEIEKSFGGNLCRCTGYRPILTAFKQLASDSDDIIDLEDIEPCIASTCLKACPRSCRKFSFYYNLKTSQWKKVYNMEDLMENLDQSGGKRYMLVAGNTARGVYHLTEETTPELYIDVTGISELTETEVLTERVIVGGNVTLTDVMDFFIITARNNSKFQYLDSMARHIDLVAHVPVRNIGTVAGNLMIKHQHQEFPSDIFLILETVNAKLVIVDTSLNVTEKTPADFLNIDMAKKVIKQVVLPAYDSNFQFTSYKVMPRNQNAHAMVNAGFLFELDSGIVKSARIVYGAINPKFVHASSTEAFLKEKHLYDNNILQEAFKVLDSELKPDWVLPDPSPTFRKNLAINLFYKCILSIAPNVSLRNKSGGTLLSRPVSNGTQQIYPNKQLYPLTQPVIKLEALAQTSGQAEYILDLPDLPGQLHGCLVKAGVKAGSKITAIDASKALKTPGVLAFFSAKDIPGVNSINVESLDQKVIEPLFCSDIVQYFYQQVGIIIASSPDAARKAAALVKISIIPPIKQPLFTIQEVLKAGKTEQGRIKLQSEFKRKREGKDIETTIEGKCYINSQYHFHMETQNCQVVPTEDGLNVFASTQWMDHMQCVISQVLKLPSQKINMFVRRLGGAFGAKITRNAFLTAAAALAADRLQKPVKMWMPFEDNMDVIGKRNPLYCNYTVKVNTEGVIQYLEATLYTDVGVGTNEPTDTLLVGQFQSGYKTDTWEFKSYTVSTDNYAHCYTRAPGTFDGLAAIENIMDHIAYSLGKDPLEVRIANLDSTTYPLLKDIVDDVVTNDHVNERKADIAQFNKDNRWKKRGLSVVPMRWYLEFKGTFTTVVSIYHLDGGVAVSHGGIEMGQGINTKVAQVCAYKLQIPLEKVSVKPSYNVASPNSTVTGGSLTSEAVVYSVMQACDVLLNRIKPIRDANPSLSWEDLIAECFTQNISLSSNGFFQPAAPKIPSIGAYSIFGACALEVEVDILTGKQEIVRVDILEDVGQSMSPWIDIGQLEGAFVMGLGAHSSEELIYNSSGQLTNNRTWNYKPPGARDIPQIFNVRFANNNLNPNGILNSKAIAEPPTCLSVAFPLAIRNALASARKDASPNSDPKKDLWYSIEKPSTTEDILLHTGNQYTQYTL